MLIREYTVHWCNCLERINPRKSPSRSWAYSFKTLLPVKRQGHKTAVSLSIFFKLSITASHTVNRVELSALQESIWLEEKTLWTNMCITELCKKSSSLHQEPSSNCFNLWCQKTIADYLLGNMHLPEYTTTNESNCQLDMLSNNSF